MEALKLIKTFKGVAEDHAELSPSYIIRRRLNGNIPSGVLAELPERPNLRRQIMQHRARNRRANPTSISDLQGVPLQYQNLLEGNKFPIYDSLDDVDHDYPLGRISFLQHRRIYYFFFDPTSGLQMEPSRLCLSFFSRCLLSTGL